MTVPQEGQVQRLLFTKKEVATALGVSTRTVDNLISVKELKARKIGKSVRVHRDDLESFAKRDHQTRVN